MKIQVFLYILCLIAAVVGHTIPGLQSLQKQEKSKRDTSIINNVLQYLSPHDNDFINTHLANLTAYNASLCDLCKNKLKYAKSLLTEYPKKDHLISLLMYKYCLYLNKNNEASCDNVDFFVTTTGSNTEKSADLYDGGLTGVTSVSFYDSDFLKVLKALNVSSPLEISYYCFYKGGGCPLPKTPDIDELYNFLAKLPAKPDYAKVSPVYNGTQEKFNVLHLSDFHIQLRYQVGSEANCSQGICCLPESYNSALTNPKFNFSSSFTALGDRNQIESGYSFYPNAFYASNGSYIKGNYYDIPKDRGFASEFQPATSFGSYLCDAPELLMNNTLKYIGEVSAGKNFEFSIFTGDLVDHDEYHCDANTTKTAEITSFNLMKYFLKQIPVYPTLGNHDTFPYGQLTPASMNYNQSYNWNDELMAKLWLNNGWLNETQADYVKNHYSGFAVTTSRGLKVISLNSNCYYQKNLWAYVNMTNDYDIFGQWQFLVDELTESERVGQRVWIISHIPPADYDALPIQSAVFKKIVERFSPYTIANMFYGHTHRDQFRILYSSNNTDVDSALQMAWVSQSVTPNAYNNPSWRYYEVEDKSFNIINSYNYYTQLNATFSNAGDEPDWQYEYSARDLYDTNHTWPSTAPLNATFWHTYVAAKVQDQSNIEMNQMFSNMQYRMSPFVPNCKNGSIVSTQCRHENYCVVSNFLSDQYIQCSKK